MLTFDSPRNKANKAGCYLRLNDSQTAELLVKEASDINYDFNWYLGNLYEALNRRNEAIERYAFLHQKDIAIYAYCNSRIRELEAGGSLFTGLIYKDRRKKVLIRAKGVGPESNTTIGEFELEEKRY